MDICKHWQNSLNKNVNFLQWKSKLDAAKVSKKLISTYIINKISKFILSSVKLTYKTNSGHKFA